MPASRPTPLLPRCQVQASLTTNLRLDRRLFGLRNASHCSAVSDSELPGSSSSARLIDSGARYNPSLSQKAPRVAQNRGAQCREHPSCRRKSFDHTARQGRTPSKGESNSEVVSKAKTRRASSCTRGASSHASQRHRDRVFEASPARKSDQVATRAKARPASRPSISQSVSQSYTGRPRLSCRRLTILRTNSECSLTPDHPGQAVN